MINFLFGMKLNKFAYLYSKLLGNTYFKNNEKIPGKVMLLTKPGKIHGKYHGILSVPKKSGTLPCPMFLLYVSVPDLMPLPGGSAKRGRGVYLQGDWADPPPRRTRKAVSTHPTGMLVCLFFSC